MKFLAEELPDGARGALGWRGRRGPSRSEPALLEVRLGLARVEGTTRGVALGDASAPRGCGLANGASSPARAGPVRLQQTVTVPFALIFTARSRGIPPSTAFGGGGGGGEDESARSARAPWPPGCGRTWPEPPPTRRARRRSMWRRRRSVPAASDSGCRNGVHKHRNASAAGSGETPCCNQLTYKCNVQLHSGLGQI